MKHLCLFVVSIQARGQLLLAVSTSEASCQGPACRLPHARGQGKRSTKPLPVRARRRRKGVSSGAVSSECCARARWGKPWTAPLRSELHRPAWAPGLRWLRKGNSCRCRGGHSSSSTAPPATGRIKQVARRVINWCFQQSWMIRLSLTKSLSSAVFTCKANRKSYGHVNLTVTFLLNFHIVAEN